MFCSLFLKGLNVNCLRLVVFYCFGLFSSLLQRKTSIRVFFENSDARRRVMFGSMRNFVRPCFNPSGIVALTYNNFSVKGWEYENTKIMNGK